MNETQKGFVQLHLSVLLAGFTGLFGRLITLNEVDIVWYRMLFTSLILLVFTGLPRVGWRKFLQLCGCGPCWDSIGFCSMALSRPRMSLSVSFVSH